MLINKYMEKYKMNEREWIESIPKFECSDGRQLKFTDEFIKDKLKKSIIE